MPLRPEVTNFAEVMEARLQKHEQKGGWQTTPHTILLHLLHDHYEALLIALNNKQRDTAEIEAADVANFAMMLWDNMRHRRVDSWRDGHA